MNALTKKLQIKPDSNWLLHNASTSFMDNLVPLPDGANVAFNTVGNFDGILLFVTNSIELGTELTVITPLLKDNTVLWIIYPKKTSKIKTDLEMMGGWDGPTAYGLRPVSSAAINETWTALRFKPVEQVKVSEGRNDAVRGNEFGEFIDVDNKIVSLPEYMQTALEQEPASLAWFHQLSYSNKKEYVLWILTAKQEKTREERLVKMVGMLADKRKNPSDKG